MVIEMNEKTALIQRLLDYAEADRPVLFVLTDDAAPEDLDEALRLIASLPAEATVRLSNLSSTICTFL